MCIYSRVVLLIVPCIVSIVWPMPSDGVKLYTLQQDLWFECSCMRMTNRNGNNWGSIVLSKTTALGAKNNCYLVFIVGGSDEIIGFRFKNIQTEFGCLDYIELFPYLREAVIDNTTVPEYMICNSTEDTNIPNHGDGETKLINSKSLHKDKFIYSSGKIFGMRVRFSNRPEQINGTSSNTTPWKFNITGEYRFLKKENFKNDGRLIPGSFCDYYFFANTENVAQTEKLDIWKYFHSPRFPANYPAHITCAYKFIGRPESRVEIVFEELELPRQEDGCNLDKLSIFDSESSNTHNIDVICDLVPTRRIISSGPDLLIEFNASSNVTAKGFRGKFKFIQNEVIEPTFKPRLTTTESDFTVEKLTAQKPVYAQNVLDWFKYSKLKENCKQVFDSRINKSGVFQTSHLHCRYEFFGASEERVQIKFHDFYIPTDIRNSTECNLSNSLQILNLIREKVEVTELLCGAFIPKPIMSDGPTLFLQFSGKQPPVDSRHTYYGFKAEYQFLTNFGIITGRQLDNNCTFAYNSTDRKSGSFSSPNFPGIYPKNVVCNYYFFGESDEKVFLRFTYFDVEGVGNCEHQTASDYVEFSNFMTIDRKFRRYCGKKDRFQILSDKRFFRVTFYSNDRFDKTGFRALYDFESNHLASENTSMQSYVSNESSKTSIVLSVLLLTFLEGFYY